MNIEIKDAKHAEELIHKSAKQEKFSHMIEIQLSKIEDRMSKGEKSVIWIFSDKGYYNNDFEEQWFSEFEENARRLFEKKGYKIQGICITW